MPLNGSPIAAIKLTCVAAVGVFVIRLIGRRVLLAWLGVRSANGTSTSPINRVLLRYEKMRTSVWLFAYFKLRRDPMFRELPELLKKMQPPKTILDVGCGYGFAGCALLEWFPDASLIGIDPSGRRVCFASKALAERGLAIRGAAPDLPMEQIPDRVDAVFVLDVIHYLDNTELGLTLSKLRERLAAGRWLIVRASISEAPTKSLLFRMERIERFFTSGHAYYRTSESIEEMLQSAGFAVLKKQMSGTKGELCWFIAAAN